MGHSVYGLSSGIRAGTLWLGFNLCYVDLLTPVVMDRGQSLIIPHLFDDTNYAYWKVRMRAFLQSLDEKVWQAVENGFPRIVRKVLRSLPERFHAKITAIEESKDIDKILLTELVGNLQTYKLGLTRIGKMGKGKSMALKVKSSDTDESSDDEDSKMKSYITRQFKKFMKNANRRNFDKDCRQSNSSQFKGQDKGRKDAKEGGQYTVPIGPKCFWCEPQ